MNDRHAILDRVREALVSPAPFPGASHPRESFANSAAHFAPPFRKWLPKVGSTFAERLELFRHNSTNLHSELRTVSSLEVLCDAVSELSGSWQRIAAHRGELTDVVCQRLNLPTCHTDGPYDKLDLEKCDVGITQCDALIAQTGSILVTTRSAGGRALSALPPHHLVLARQNQLIADLPDAFELLDNRYSPGYPSLISFITGPSRTADIERTVVLGAHGPRKLTICLLCDAHDMMDDESSHPLL